MVTVIKNNGSSQEFELKKVKRSVKNAMKSSSSDFFPRLIDAICLEIKDTAEEKKEIPVKEIDRLIVHRLRDYGQESAATNYERFKTLKYYKKSKGIVDNEIEGLLGGTNSKVIDENSNKDSRLLSTQRDLISGIVSRDYAERKMIPIDLLQAHQDGLIHLHDTDYMIQASMFNCQLINLKDMLQNGTVINGKLIERPKSIQTAATIATQISLSVANSQFGGQTFSLSHLAPFVRLSYERYIEDLRNDYIGEGKEPDEEFIKKQAERMTRKEVVGAIQTIQFQENTFSSGNGQTPFVSIFLYINEEPEYKKETALLIEETLKLRLLGMKNADGVYVTPAFPKLLYCLDENNVPPDSEYRYLTDLAVKCASKRLNPDFISAKIMKRNYEGNVFPCMGCRSFLAPWKDGNGNYKFYGRFNRGVCTINLVDAALSAKKDINKFWEILDERLELVKRALQMRTEQMRGSLSDVSPIHWQHGSIARLKPGEKIDKFLDNGYSTISLGYIGIYEMCMAMLGVSNTSEKGSKFALDVIKYLADKAKSWKTEPGLAGASLYGTPSESLCYKFAQKTAKRFGKIKDITDKDWFTNSYHVCVSEPIDAFSKLKFEAQFQNLSTGGACQYVEVPNMSDNLEALAQIVDFMYENVQYAEVNSRCSDVCSTCGFQGEIKTDNNGVWTCPNCGETRRSKLTVVRRTCGYLGTNFWNKGKTEEISKRVYHI